MYIYHTSLTFLLGFPFVLLLACCKKASFQESRSKGGEFGWNCLWAATATAAAEAAAAAEVGKPATAPPNIWNKRKRGHKNLKQPQENDSFRGDTWPTKGQTARSEILDEKMALWDREHISLFYRFPCTIIIHVSIRNVTNDTQWLKYPKIVSFKI